MKIMTQFNKITLALLLATISASSLADDGHQKANNAMDHSGMEMKMSSGSMSEVGMPAPGVKPNKVVHVLLADDSTISFKKEVKIEPNDVVQFVVLNVGDEVHEFSIGSASEQIKHREMMKKMGNHQHDSGSAVTVMPGKAKQLTWHFHGQTEVELACNIPGHAEDGMVKYLSL